MSNTLPLSQPSALDAGHSRTDIKTIRLEKTLLLLWLLANLIIGIVTVHQYGMSVDEPNNQRYAADTLAAYPSFFGLRYAPYYDSSYDGHGPAFVTLAILFVRLVQGLFPNLYAPDLWHFSYFITFQLTGLCLYWLAKRWFHIWTAWGVLILFSTQPVLRGHAFMNPKDIPFTCFITLSVLLGVQMVDALGTKEPFVSLVKPVQTLSRRFRESDPRRRKRFLIYLAFGVMTALVLILFSRQINALIGSIILFFYNAEPGSWAGQLFASVANSKVPVADYTSKALRLFDRVERGLFAAGALFFLCYFELLIHNTTLRAFLRTTWSRRHQVRDSTTSLAGALKNSWQGESVKLWFAEFFRALRRPRVIFAGVALGLATGVRAIGPVAGVIVVLYLFAKLRSRAWATALAYFLVSGVMTYIAWPRLWDAPITRYLEALGIASNFPHFPGQVLFDGKFYGPTDLPTSYLPTLFSIQLTEPLVLGIYVGLGLLIWQLLRSRLRTDLFLYIGLGFLLPLVGLVALNSPLYHNFRQVLFLVPAMIMSAALALELVFTKLRQTWIRVVLIAVLGLPGVYSTVKLYPYEYVYYNSLVGGTAGAATRYELDYWRISLREMALELNKVARPGSLVVVTRSAGLLARYTRPDLVIDKPINSTLNLESGYDYIVHVARGKGEGPYPEVENLIVIERAGAVIATAKDVKGISKE